MRRALRTAIRRGGGHAPRRARPFVPRREPLEHTRRVDEVARLPEQLTAWLGNSGAHLLPPTLDEPTWRVRLGPKLLASQATAHNAILAAERVHRLGLPCQRVEAPLTTPPRLL